jgi:large subunit ribosomal protein L24
MAMQNENIATKLKKGDQVVVLSGKEKGKRGSILKVNAITGRVVVEGVNMVSKTVRKKSQEDQGGIIQIEAAIHISNVAILDAKGNPTRVAYKGTGADKVRVAVTTGDKL